MKNRDSNQNRNRESYFNLREFRRRHAENHRLEKEMRAEIIREHKRNHQEIHRIQAEFRRRMGTIKRQDKSLQWYKRHSRNSQIFILVFNLIIWFLIFRYFGLKTVAVGVGVIFGIGGTIQILFNIRVEKSIFIPISRLKDGVDEIAKGNYDINIECEVRNDVGTLIDSFNDMAKKLKESEEVKVTYEENRKSLIANISHDLKTPITSIQGYIETMASNVDIPKETINKYHQIIYNNAVYMNKLIEDLFLFSKLDMQKLELNFEKIGIRAFMNDLMEEFKFELEDREISFTYIDKLSKEYNVNIDRKRIQQIFSNIIGNAVKYGFEANLKIKIELYEKDDSLYIDMFNNGPEIPEDKLPYIFDRFYRVDYARTKNLMSTGLGLAISKELVEAHGGKISAANIEGEGTCFTIVLLKDKSHEGGN